MLDLLNLQWLNHNLQSKFSHEILDFDKILSLLYNRVLYANFDQFLAFYNENRGHTQILEKKVDFFLKLTPSTTVNRPSKSNLSVLHIRSLYYTFGLPRKEGLSICIK